VTKPKTLFLHPGLSKCGSTALQYTLAANAERLAQQGFCVPKAATNSPTPGHHIRLAKAIRMNDADAYRDVTQRIFREADGHDGIVISSEGLHSLGRHPMMHDFLSLFENVHILIFIRPHAERLPSAFSQQIKNGYAAFAAEGGDLFSAWKCSITDRKDHKYANTVTEWLSAPNVTSARVTYYSRNNSHDDILRGLNNLLNQTIDSPWKNKTVNPSLSVDGLKFKLVLNRLLPNVDLHAITLLLFKSSVATASEHVIWHDEEIADFSKHHYQQATEKLSQSARSDKRLVLDPRLLCAAETRIETGPTEALKTPLEEETYQKMITELHCHGFDMSNLVQQAFCSTDAEHWPSIRLQRQVRKLQGIAK
jgi:hypothetical protein